ncbi:MAG: FHA domain-containing protein [Pyrinomonadaceae bacterium]
MQWDKFSTDSEKSIEILRNELHVAAIDHINDKRYYTYQPIELEIKPDYFTDGVKLLAGFNKIDETDFDAEVNLSVPNLLDDKPQSATTALPEPEKHLYSVKFAIKGKEKEIEIGFLPGDRKSVGRSRENDIALEDNSVSKVHAALVFNSLNNLVVADTGSTNGTFINEGRIAYGRAYPVENGDVLKFGSVEMVIHKIAPEIEENQFEEESGEIPKTEEFGQFSHSKTFESDETPTPVLSENSSPGFNTTEIFSGRIGEEVNQNKTGSNEPFIKKEDEFSDSLVFDERELTELKSPSEETAEPEKTQPGIVLDFGENS